MFNGIHLAYVRFTALPPCSLRLTILGTGKPSWGRHKGTGQAQHLGTSGERPGGPPSSHILVNQKSCTSQSLSPTGSNPLQGPRQVGLKGWDTAPDLRIRSHTDDRSQDDQAVTPVHWARPRAGRHTSPGEPRLLSSRQRSQFSPSCF